VYNILAAYAACRECGVEGAAIADTLSSYILKNGRMQTFTLGQHHGILLTSKHENSIAYDTNLRYIASTNEDCTVLIIVDAVSRKYFTSETSWLWDIDFDQLNVPHVKRVILSGMTTEEQVEDNLATFSHLEPLNEVELAVVDEVRAAIQARVFVSCTGCQYCMPCPFGVDIPRNFRMMNQYAMYNNELSLESSWKNMDEGARATACKKCGKCERACPQHLPIRQKLMQIAEKMK